MKKCDHCKSEHSILRIRIGANNFCSANCTVEYAKLNPTVTWTESIHYGMLVEEVSNELREENKTSPDLLPIPDLPSTT